MKDIKRSQIADGVGYLYRAAFHMAQGQKKLAESFLKTAEEKLGKKVVLPKNKDDKFIAEKILDEYRNNLILFR